jgi:phage terminase small subunit
VPRGRGLPQDGELSAERLAFCEGLLKGKSARQAYEESGFEARGRDAKSNARQLLKEPEIQFYLAVRRMELRERVSITDERVLREMLRIALWDPAEVVTEDIREPADIARLPEHVRRVIVGWKHDRFGNFILEFADKTKALEQLARYLGLFQQDRRNVHDVEPDLIQTAFWRFVVATHVQEEVTVAEAINRARANPEAVESWGRSVGLLPAEASTGSEQ